MKELGSESIFNKPNLRCWKSTLTPIRFPCLSEALRATEQRRSTMNADIFAARQAAALQAIKSLYGKPEGEYGPTLFVSHHLEEVEAAYWLRTFGTAQPNPDQVLNALVLVNSWSSEGDENIDTFDFSLPEKATNYVLSVRFQDDGQVQDVSMES
jgi:Protein of unknown function (DUF2004)